VIHRTWPSILSALQDETVVTLVVMSLDVRNATSAGTTDSLLSLSTPRGLVRT
jgi:hypothetical protein